MAVISKSNAPIPELFAEAVDGAFASQTALMGSLAMKLGIVKSNGSFPQSGPDKIGETVSVPYFGTLGEYQSRTDGTPATPTAFTTTKESGTIGLGTLGFEMTTWAAASPLPGRSPYEEAARQVVAAAERYADRVVLDAAVNVAAGSNALVLDKYSATSPINVSYDLLTQGLGLWNDFGNLAELAAIGMHSKVFNDMLQVKNAVGEPMLIDFMDVDGLKVPTFKYWGKPILVSDRLPVDNSVLSAVVSAGTSPPVITVAASTNREGKTGPVRPCNVLIAVTTTGTLGTWKFKLSLDGGATWDNAYTSAASVALTDPYDPAGGLLGITLSIAAGTASANNTWAFQTAIKHTTLLLKKESIAFWYNAKYAGVLQSVPVPMNDSVQYASHLYSVAHRYKRMPSQPLPGVVVIRHNAGGL